MCLKLKPGSSFPYLLYPQPSPSQIMAYDKNLGVIPDTSIISHIQSVRKSCYPYTHSLPRISPCLITSSTTRSATIVSCLDY